MERKHLFFFKKNSKPNVPEVLNVLLDLFKCTSHLIPFPRKAKIYKLWVFQMEVRSPLTDSDHGKRPSPTMLNGMRVEKAGLDSQINTERVW